MTKKRKTVLGVVTGIAAAVAVIWGFDIAPEQIEAITNAIVSILNATSDGGAQ